MQSMCDKDSMADNKNQPMCEGNTNHIRAIPQESAIQRQKNRYTRGHRDSLKNKCSKTKIEPILKLGMRHQQMTLNLVHITTMSKKQPMVAQ